jgi:hypothetical protein
MKKGNLFLGMLAMVLAFGFVLASRSQVFEGETATAKAVKLTLKSSSYEIEYEGKTYSGDAKKVSALGIDTYTWTSGGTGGVVVADKKATVFSFSNGDVSIGALELTKRSVANGEISLDDIELILEE